MEFEDENNDLNENINDDNENIGSILERTKYNIENQHNIMYQ